MPRESVTCLPARGRSVVGRRMPVFEQVNLQVVLDAWCGAPGRSVGVHGLALPQHYGGLGLQDLLHGDGLPPVRLSAPDLVDLPSGPDATVACWRSALLLVQDARGAYALLVKGPDRHEEPALQLEVAGLETAVAQEVHRELSELRSQLNVYRGQVLELVQSGGGIGVAFPVLPTTDRADVVLPEAVLRRVERHTVDIAERREQLRAAGQHLKRGLLLYGPPGTGKTHTTRYVVQRLVGSTVLMLSGRTLHLIGEVTARRPMPTCCSCSRPTGPTCSSRHWRPGRAGWTSRSRSVFRTRRHGAACSRSTAAGCRSRSPTPTSLPW